MRIALVGPEFEENLALRYLEGALRRAGHETRIFDFRTAEQIGPTARQIDAWGPDLVGLSLVFTLRAGEFLELAAELRRRGLKAHITAGGHFAALHAPEVLTDYPAIDTIVHGEGEEALVELAARLDAPQAVAGLSYRDAAGAVRRTAPRPNPADLDGRAWPTRPDAPPSYLGQPIANMISSRGCYAACRFCSIRAWHNQNGGCVFRQRDPAKVAAEMAWLHHRRGVRLYNFHDDNFLVPAAGKNLERLGRLRRELDRLGVGRIGIQIKARPDCLHEEVVRALEALGLFRVFLGVESNAVAGLKHLGRGIRREENCAALELLGRRHVHVAFNLLMFEPEATLSDLRDNAAFIARFRAFPLNFCRVEVYAGTDLERQLRAENRLIGNYLGYTYRLTDARVQLAYEVFRTVFHERNFTLEGLNHHAMTLDYFLHLLRHFHPGRVTPALWQESKALVEQLNVNNAELLGRAMDFAEGAALEDGPAGQRFAEELREERRAFDARHGPLMVGQVLRLRAAAETATSPPRLRAGRAAAALAAGAALGLAACDTHLCEMAPPATQPRTQPAKPAGASAGGGPSADAADGQATAPVHFLADDAPAAAWGDGPLPPERIAIDAREFVADDPGRRFTPPEGLTQPIDPAPAATQPAATQPATQPATRPAPPGFGDAEIDKIEREIIERHGPALGRLVQQRLGADRSALATPWRVEIELDAAGKVAACDIHNPPKDHAAFIRDLRTMIRSWQFESVKQRGSAIFKLDLQKAVRRWMDEITPPCEMAAPDMRGRFR